VSDFDKTADGGRAMMGRMSTHAHHAIDYVEITVTDMDAAELGVWSEA
jgi:hypothetical protein